MSVSVFQIIEFRILIPMASLNVTNRFNPSVTTIQINEQRPLTYFVMIAFNATLKAVDWVNSESCEETVSLMFKRLQFFR